MDYRRVKNFSCVFSLEMRLKILQGREIKKNSFFGEKFKDNYESFLIVSSDVELI
jgi:hypothetical protein